MTESEIIKADGIPCYTVFYCDNIFLGTRQDLIPDNIEMHQIFTFGDMSYLSTKIQCDYDSNMGGYSKVRVDVTLLGKMARNEKNITGESAIVQPKQIK